MKIQDFLEKQDKSRFKRLYILTELFMGKMKYCYDCHSERGHCLTKDITEADVFISKKQALFYLEECGELIMPNMAIMEALDMLPVKIRISDATLGFGLSIDDIATFAKEEGNDV